MEPNDRSEADVAAAITRRMAEIGLDEDADAARDVVEQFVDTIRAYREAAEEAHRAGDPAALAQAAHRLAGTALTLGADELGQRASRIESDAQTGRGATLDAQLEGLTAAADRAVAAARSILDGI